MQHVFRLRSLPVTLRLALACALLTLVGGSAASGLFLYMQYEKRDESPGLTLTDIEGHYHGVRTPSPLVEAISNGHPKDLDPRKRKLLLEWLASDNPGATYDDLDLGDDAPAEILAQDCLSCHSRSSTGPDAYAKVPLEFWDDVRVLAVSRDIQPVDRKILAASTHTHALSLSMLVIVVGALSVMTSWPRVLVNLVVLATCAGLLLDITSWWLAGENLLFARVIVVAGGVFNAGLVLQCVLILLDLCMPRPKTRGKAE
ncbi:MAG: hypothetical protein RBS39_05085 [Phycisphaerales bacterium]|jgi:hypothetical protein|nr:hypothetical protein [Phycisphaerales bacterium]